ncbi:MAG: dipeptide epimerase [Alphaproteobacteria bacterium]|nr:dipeptide epimerase [Alphaproteobacteria bacterium]
MIKLTVRREVWPIRGSFTISRGSKTEAVVVVVELTERPHRGRGECVPYARYGETVEGVIAAIEALSDRIEAGIDRHTLLEIMPAGAARNAVDCALWDLEAKRSGKPAWTRTGFDQPKATITAYTLSLDTAEKMGAAAAENAHRPLLKLKLAGTGDLDRVAAVRAGAPKSELIVDANEGWTADHYRDFAPKLGALGVVMIEQPLPANNDGGLMGLERPVPVCADEACHDAATLDKLVGKYDLINIKLDKTGGLTEALRLKAAAEAKGLGIMVGCMIGTSLGMAPGMLLAQGARYVDLDAPLLLDRDRQPGLRYEGSTVYPPLPALWG